MPQWAPQGSWIWVPICASLKVSIRGVSNTFQGRLQSNQKMEDGQKGEHNLRKHNKHNSRKQKAVTISEPKGRKVQTKNSKKWSIPPQPVAEKDWDGSRRALVHVPPPKQMKGDTFLYVCSQVSNKYPFNLSSRQTHPWSSQFSLSTDIWPCLVCLE